MNLFINFINNHVLDDQNRKNFESVHNSFFVMCLDGKSLPTDSQIDSKTVASGQILHGNKQFTANRWFDKTIQGWFDKTILK